MPGMLPPTFQVHIHRAGLLGYRLVASQVLPVCQEKAFGFFEDPRNLCDITPVWLDFCMLDRESVTGIRENAEFEYTITFLGITMAWRSRIIDYHPPERFTDIQLKGPYRSWVHLHKLEKVPEGTLMTDEVSYTLPVLALGLNPFLIREKLIDIFSYRAVKIAEWAKNVT